MRRLIVAIFLIALGAVIAIWLALEPGSAQIAFQGWVIETSFAALAVFLLLLGFLIALLWRLAGWLIGLPGKVRRGAARARAQRGYDALERALIASAAGDGGLARRQAARAGELLDRPLLTRVISARAAEAAGEVESAEADYRLLLETPETEIVGLRGLAQAALARGDLKEAQARAAAAFARNPQARWAFEALFEAQTRTADWAKALQTLAVGEKQGHLSGEVARRRRAVLLSAQAAEAESAADFDLAKECAVAATQAFPGFAPGVALAARLLLREGKDKKAARVLEDCWRAAPHPAVAVLWRELVDDTAPAAEQAAHMDRLARLAPEHRESRILLAEDALLRGEPDVAAAHLITASGPRTARILALQARIAEARGDHESARRLIAEGVGAPGEPDWSDIDPMGPAFAYSNEDWARLVFVFGEQGRLIHPRHERFLPELISVPALPLLPRPGQAAQASAAERDNATGSLFGEEPKTEAAPLSPPSPDDPGPYGDPLEEEDPEQVVRDYNQ